MAASIVVNDVSKRFTIQRNKTLKKRITGRLRHQQSKDTIFAVDNVSFRVPEGQAVGLMGLNGSGKSTLLKLISGVMKPDTGTVRTRGRIAGLIEVGAGFHPDLTGRENIYLNGAILGMSESQINAKFDAIVEFAEVERFLDTPVGNYSSGMFMRLGFAVSVATDCDIFLIDEVLAVGDRPFKRKCLKRIGELHREGRTIFLVSHSTEHVRRICSRGLVLEKGQLAFDGEVEDAIGYLGYGDEPDDE